MWQLIKLTIALGLLFVFLMFSVLMIVEMATTAYLHFVPPLELKDS